MAGICFVMAIAAFFVLPRDTLKVVDPRLDWPGAVLVTVGLVLLMFVISDGQNAPNGWSTGCECSYSHPTVALSSRLPKPLDRAI
jgi:hypothetical protein